jgi:hypothetical protein
MASGEVHPLPPMMTGLKQFRKLDQKLHAVGVWRIACHDDDFSGHQ